MVRIGIDVGGTFTKAVACDASTGEIVARAVVPTTHSSPSGIGDGVVTTLREVTDEVWRTGAGPVALVAHSTTQAVNALLEGDTATVGVLGFGQHPDVRRARKRTHLGEVRLAPGRHLQTRCSFIDTTHGCDRCDVEAAIAQLIERGAEVLCVSQAFGVDDPRWEFMALDVARDMGLPACAGHELSGLYGLEMRTVTGAINASILPAALATASLVEDAVDGDAEDVPLLVMRGDGGAADVVTMRRQPLLTAFSGPAASVAGALRHLSIRDGLVIEVGGTSTNVSVVTGGHPVLSYVRVLDHVTCVRSLDVRVVGVAGGSLLRVGTRLGRPRIVDVGPRSAHIANLEYCSFAPAHELERASVELISPRAGDPAAYAVLVSQSGTRFAPTVTCAANALGVVADGSYAVGNEESARRAFERLAATLDGDWRTIARATLDIAGEKVAAVVREATRDQKVAPQSIIGLGGGAGALVPSVAERTGSSWHIPPDAEVISSVGDALSLVRVEIERSISPSSPQEVAAAHRAAEDGAIAAGAAPDTIQIESRAIPERRAVRVAAVGAVALDSGAASGNPMSLDDESLGLIAKETLGDDVERITTGKTYWVFAAGAERERPFAVVDRRGAVALKGKGRVLTGTGADVVEELEATLPALTRHFGPLSIAPSLRLLRGARLIDLSLFSSTEKVLQAARVECSRAGDDEVVVFLMRD
ncbi:MAG: methylhydantoinase [Actinomycetota bacterium]|nr:methylhydantoinase [Actinomycetota bacterium]